MGVLDRLRDAWRALRGHGAPALTNGKLVEATFEEVYGTPVTWTELYTANGRMLFPPSWGAEQRREKNATLRTLQDHDRARNASRVLAETNPNAIGLLQRLTAYNVGKGSSTEVQAVKEDAEPPKRLAAKVREFLKTFKRQGGRLDRWPAVEKEMVFRLHVDGEFFLRFFPQKDGTTLVRFVEPANVRPPLGVGDEGPWSYGIHTPEEQDGGYDAEAPAAYNLHDFRTGTDEEVEAQFILHAKINCLSNQKRGVPSLYAAEEELRGSAKLRYSIREGEKNRSAITYFRRHKGATKGAIQAFQQEQATAHVNRYVDGSTAAPSGAFVEVLEPNSVIDIPDGLDPLPPPSNPNSTTGSQSIDSALEAVAARFGVPAWIVTGKSDSGNFAQSLVAESPFTVTLQDSQAELAQLSDACQTKALEIGAEQGLLPEDVLDQVDLLVTFPSPVSRNKKEETDRRKVLKENNVISETQWITEEGYDPDKQRQQMREERADPILPLPETVKSAPVDPRTGAPVAYGNGNGATASGTAAARYAQLTGRGGLSEQEDDEGRLREALGRMTEEERADFFTLLEGFSAGRDSLLVEATKRKEGEEWETAGRRYKREQGKTVRVASKKAEPEKKPKPQKLTVDDAHALLKQSGGDPRQMAQALLGLTVPEVKDLRKKMGLIKGSSPKQTLVDDLVAKVAAGGTKPAGRPKGAPAPKEGPKAEPAAGPGRTAAEHKRAFLDRLQKITRGAHLATTPANPEGFEPRGEPAVLDRILDAVEAVKRGNSFVPAKLADLYAAARGADPALTARGFQDAMFKLQADGKVRLAPFTQSPASLPDEYAATAMIMDSEIKAYADVNREGKVGDRYGAAQDRPAAPEGPAAARTYAAVGSLLADVQAELTAGAEAPAGLRARAEAALDAMGLERMSPADLAAVARKLGAHHAGLKGKGALADAIRRVVLEPIELHVGGAG